MVFQRVGAGVAELLASVRHRANTLMALCGTTPAASHQPHLLWPVHLIRTPQCPAYDPYRLTRSAPPHPPRPASSHFRHQVYLDIVRELLTAGADPNMQGSKVGCVCMCLRRSDARQRDGSQRLGMVVLHVLTRPINRDAAATREERSDPKRLPPHAPFPPPSLSSSSSPSPPSLPTERHHAAHHRGGQQPFTPSLRP